MSNLKFDKLTYLLIGIIIAGICLRFYKLGYASLWLDEAATVFFSDRPIFEIINATAQGEYNPPGFYILEHFMLMIGRDEFTIRLIPAITGCLTIPAFYQIGKVLRDRYTGVLMAALLAFSPFAIWYSADARAYAPTLLIFCIMFLMYLKASKENLPYQWIAFGALGALGWWFHLYFIVPFGILLLWEFSQRWDIKSVVLSGAVFTGLTAPLALITINLFGLRTAAPPTYGIQGLELVKETALQFSGFFLWAMFVFLILFILGISWLSMNDKPLTLMIYTILAITFGISIYLSYRLPFLPRYIIYLLPFFYLGIACSIQWSKKYKGWLTIAMVALIVILAVFPLCQYWSGESKDNWKAVASTLTNYTNEGDWVLSIPYYNAYPMRGYWDNQTDGTIDFSEPWSYQYIQEHPHEKTYIVVSREDSMADLGDNAGPVWDWVTNNSKLLYSSGRIQIRVRT
jgi:uncharacterized membrane protein